MKEDTLQVNTNNTALLVIDPQKDFFTGDKKDQLQPLHEALSKLDTFIKNCRAFRIPVVFTKYIERDGEVPQNILEKDLNGTGVVGTGGEQFIGVDENDADLVIEKNTWDAFSNPELHSFLQKRNIKNVLITGVDTEVCVLSTISSAFSKGYTVIVVKELVATEKGKSDMHEMILKIVNQYYGYVVEAQDLINKLKD